LLIALKYKMASHLNARKNCGIWVGKTPTWNMPELVWQKREEMGRVKR
jgi:hypothetical protein